LNPAAGTSRVVGSTDEGWVRLGKARLVGWVKFNLVRLGKVRLG